MPDGESANLLSPREFKKRLPKIGLGAVYEGIHDNRIRHLKLGRKILILGSEVTEWPRREAERGRQ